MVGWSEVAERHEGIGLDTLPFLGAVQIHRTVFATQNPSGIKKIQLAAPIALVRTFKTKSLSEIARYRNSATLHLLEEWFL